METKHWHYTCDVVVVGSGAAALTAAITAQHNGMNVLVVESYEKWGGNSSYSGGGLWIPNNYLMQEAGALDSPEEALEYMEAVIKDVGAASSRARKENYIHNAPKVALFLKELGFKWVRAELYPDYYPNVKGAKTGRVIEGAIFNGYKLKSFRKTQLYAKGMPPIALTSARVYLMPIWLSTWKGFKQFAKMASTTAWWLLTGRYPLTIGRSLVAQMMYILQSNWQTPVWLSSPMKDVIIENGRAVGITVEKDGQLLNVKATKAVMLGAGGFEKNAEYRKKYQPVTGEWSSGAPSNQGDGIRAGERVGAALSLMDEAWWGGSFMIDGNAVFSVTERSMPGSIVVDRLGKRFVNESTSYVDFGRKMLDRDKEIGGGASPAWMIMDGNYRKDYMFGMMPPGFTPSKYLKNGTIVKGETLDELAQKCDIDKAGLAETVKRFNSFARHGKDEDFGRGQDIYDRYYSEHSHMPNSNLKPIEHAPYYAVRIYTGDLGTKGGLLTDEFARVLREDGSVIEGLYASGNTTASVMGRTYPGPGSTIGPACTFSYIAMNHLAEKIK